MKLKRTIQKWENMGTYKKIKKKKKENGGKLLKLL